jgi:hypothetical protein
MRQVDTYGAVVFWLAFALLLGEGAAGTAGVVLTCVALAVAGAVRRELRQTPKIAQHHDEYGL